MGILQTFLEVHRTVIESFPLAETKIQFDRNQGVFIEVIPTHKYSSSSFVLHTAVIHEEFSHALKKLHQKIHLAEITERKDISPLKLKKLEIKIPLTDWQKFQRVLYEQQGKSCVDALQEYLERPDDAALFHQLELLGLAPHQIENGGSEADFIYFRKLLPKILSLPPELKKIGADNFRKKFPRALDILLLEMTKTERKQGVLAEKDVFEQKCSQMRTRVVGQNQAIECVATALVSQQNQDKNTVFLFVGPSGVGKTELAKATGALKGGRFCRFDMQCYPNSQDLSKFFGSPLGCVGSTDRPVFAKAMDQFNPIKTSENGDEICYEIKDVVILFDEFEKSHSDIKQSLLSLFDEGVCTVSYTKLKGFGGGFGDNVTLKYIFKSSVLISTSNLYKEEILKWFCQGGAIDQFSDFFKEVNRISSNPQGLSDELINRTKVVPFGPIPRGQSYQKVIALKMKTFCSEFKQELQCKDVDIEDKKSFFEAIENVVYGNGTDLRKIESYLNKFRTEFYKRRKEFGKMSTKKITFNSDANGPFIKLYTFLDVFGYQETDVSPVRLP